MVFSSNVFLFLFLPAFLAAYYLCPDRYRSWVIVAGSYLFYAWWRVDFLLLFVGVTAFNYWVGQNIHRHGARSAGARRWLTLGVTADLAVLGYFKYANFGVDSFNALLALSGSDPMPWAAILLPIGISFYTFEAISYIVDVYRGDCEPARNPVDFACFLALFPHLIAGPVFRYKDLADQFHGRRHSLELFAEGSRRFMLGFVKKVFIADSIAPLVAAGYALPEPSTADAWLTMVAYTLQLYFDFSGYSDMAIGLGLMLGFRFVENFDQPYISQSITEFWRRWHMSLSAWLRDYLYVALGGNRGGRLATYRNLFLTMVLGGLWHGANWTFVLWGVFHGAVLALERLAGVRAQVPAFNPARWALTLLLVMLGWVMFRAASVEEAARLYAALFRFDGQGLSELYASSVTSLQLATLALAGALVLWAGLDSRARLGGETRGPVLVAVGPLRAASPLVLTALLPLFALSVLKLSAQSHSPFLYFQF